MSSKIGIIFAFLLSIAAAGGAYFLYQGWVEERDLRGTIEAKYDQVTEKMAVVQSEKEKFKTESEQYKAESEENRNKAQAMQEQLAKLEAEQTKINEERSHLQKQLADHQGLISSLQGKVEELEKKAKEAQQACITSPLDLKPTLASSEPQPFGETTASSVVTETPAPVETAAPIIPATATVTPVESATVQPVVQEAQPSQVAAVSETKMAPKVLTVNRKFNFVVVNLGLRDGLKMGDHLKVLKQGKDSSTLVIEKLYDKFSAATILEEDPQQRVAENDEVRKA